MASLAGSGPFSRLPGVDRIIIQIDGAPMRLTHGPGAEKPRELFEPYRFSGDDETASVLDGAARDFNVMTARGRIQAAATTNRMGVGARTAAALSGDELAVYCVFGTVVAGVSGAVGESLDAGSMIVARSGGNGLGLNLALAAVTDAVVITVSFTHKT